MVGLPAQLDDYFLRGTTFTVTHEDENFPTRTYSSTYNGTDVIPSEDTPFIRADSAVDLQWYNEFLLAVSNTLEVCERVEMCIEDYFIGSLIKVCKTDGCISK